MRQSPLLEFASSDFPVGPGEDADTNPGIYGKGLAHWLPERLRVAGVPAGDVFAEDFGWCIPVQSAPHALFVVCASSSDEANEWRVFAFAEGGTVARLLGRDRSVEAVRDLYRVVKLSIEQAPGTHHVREVTE
jgi:hypothetical protein